MKFEYTSGQAEHHSLTRKPFLVSILLFATACVAQVAPAQPTAPLTTELNKYSGLLAEFGRFFEKVQHNGQFPPERSQSHLLPLLPDSTMFYGAIPNYGDAAHQVLEVFHHELEHSSVLRNWWLHSDVAATGPKIEDSLEWFYEVSQYLGDEIVISGGTDGRDPNLLIISEVRKPGLNKALQEIVKEVGGEKKLPVRVFEPQELATARDGNAPGELDVLVRPDYVAAAPKVAALRSFNSLLDRKPRAFLSSPFGQRMEQAYRGGTTVLAGADLHSIINLLPSSSSKDEAAFQRSGFRDVKYLVWQHKNVGRETVSQWELSFTGPRHGVANWLARPRPLGSVDFVSSKAIFAATFVLNNPPQILQDIKELSTASNPSAFESLAQMERALNLSVKDDLLRYLDGEITVELDDVATPAPVWKALLRVTDSTRVQQTLSTLLAVARLPVRQVPRDGITYYSVRIPSAKNTVEIAYAFVDGYLIIASSPDTLTEAVELHGTVDSLAKSQKFLAALPPGHPEGASVLLYQDPNALMALRLRQVAPRVASPLASQSTPIVFCAYGEDTAIRGASANPAFDAGTVLVGAAIAIPNLLRARIAANEASAVGTMRTVNTAQIAYATTYPQRGYAPDLATLGPDPRNTRAASAEHAGLIDPDLGAVSCATRAWCTKSGFRFNLTAACKQKPCKQFVVVGTPVSSSTGARSFCSTADAVIRFKTGPPLSLMPTAAECQKWSPVQ